MSTAVVTRQEQAHATPPSTINAVRQMEKQFALALPEHVSAERFVRIVVTAIQSNPDLQSADRDSVLGAALKCAQDGLIPDGREAALVVYNTKVKYRDENGRDREAWVKRAQYMPMIAGILTKVRRSGELHSLSANVVYEQDAFEYELGDEERLIHRPFMSGPRGKAIAAYAIAKTKDGGIYREVMSVEQIEKVRGVSRAKNNGPWVDWWDEMARKSVMRRLSKRLPMSTDLTQIFARDDDHYDLRAQSQGEATLRRLHADFDEPAPPAIEDTAKTVTFEDAPDSDTADDDFPGDLAPPRGEEPRRDAQERPEGVSTATMALQTVSARVAAFRAHALKAPNSATLLSLQGDRHFAALLADMDAGDPDEVGSSADLRLWLDELIDAKRAEERAKGGA